MAAVGHIQTLCDSIVTHLQGTTWTDLPVASERLVDMEGKRSTSRD